MIMILILAGLFLTVLRAYRSENGKKQTINFYATDITTTGEYQLDTPGERTAGFTDRTVEPSCTYDARDPDYMSGKLVITTLDKVNYIVAGTFEFTVAKADCDTIRVTEGRFDMRYGY